MRWLKELAGLSDRRGLRPERQPTEGDRINAGLPPSGELGDEAGTGDFRGGEGEAAGIALVEVEAGQAEVDNGRCRERRAEIDRKAQDADLIVIVGRRRGEGPPFGEVADLHRGGQGFPGLHNFPAKGLRFLLGCGSGYRCVAT